MTLTFLEQAVAKRGQIWLAESAEPTQSVVDLSADELGGTSSDTVRAATIEAIAQHHGDHYTRRPGIAPLCKAVASYLGGFGLKINPDNEVVVSGGAQESRFVALRALGAKQTVYVPEVAPWHLYAVPLAFAEAIVQRFDPQAELQPVEGGLLVLPNPNPATGQAYDSSTLDRLAAWVLASDLTVVADETYAPLFSSYRPFATWPGMAERTLTLGSFAAAPGLAGWQVAWFAGAKLHAIPVRDLKQAMTICSPAASQYAALAATPAGDSAALEAQNQQLAKITSLLDRLELPYIAPHINAFVCVDVQALGGGDAVAAACAKQGVLVASGAGFGLPNMVRITAAQPELELGLERFEAAITALRQPA